LHWPAKKKTFLRVFGAFWNERDLAGLSPRFEMNLGLSGRKTFILHFLWSMVFFWKMQNTSGKLVAFLTALLRHVLTAMVERFCEAARSQS
jgi:hypothetical protein